MARKQLTKESILEATLSLIDEKGSSHALNFREIARRMNCAHQSLYNYYESYVELQQLALKTTAERIRADLNYEGDIVAYSLQLVDFVMAHPGWYRFLWMDHLEQKVTEVLRAQQRPGVQIMASFMVSEGAGMTLEQASDYLQVGHSYVHGELVQYLSGRSQYRDPLSLREGIQKKVTAMREWVKQAAKNDVN